MPFFEIFLTVPKVFLTSLTLLEIQQITFISHEYSLECMQYLKVGSSKLLRGSSTSGWCIIVGPWMTREHACEFGNITSRQGDFTEYNLRA